MNLDTIQNTMLKKAVGESAGDYFATRQQNMSRVEQADNNRSLGRMSDGSPKPTTAPKATGLFGRIGSAVTGAIGNNAAAASARVPLNQRLQQDQELRKRFFSGLPTVGGMAAGIPSAVLNRIRGQQGAAANTRVPGYTPGAQTNWPQNANPNMSQQEFNTYLQGARTATTPQERDEFLYQANLLPPRTQQDMAMNQLFSNFRSMPQRTPEQIGQNVQAIRSMYGAPQVQK